MFNGRDPFPYRPALAIALGALAMAAPVGCATTETVADAPSTSSASEPVADDRPAHRQLGYRLEWRGFPVTADRAEIDEVDLYDDIIVVRDSANTLSVVESDSGTNRWAAEVGSRLDRVYGTIRDDLGRILVSGDTELSIFDPKAGTLIDRQSYSFLTSTAPVTLGRFVIVGGENGQLLIHNTTSGYRQHAYDFGATLVAPPVLVGDFVAAAARNGRVFVIDPRSGSSVGRTRVYASVEAAPDASENAVFIASRDQSLWCFEARQGTTRWRVRTEGPLTRDPVYHDGVVYCFIPKKGLSAFDSNTGEEIWASGVDADAVCTVGDRLLAWDGSTIHALQTVTGDVLSTHDLPGVDRVLADRFEDGNLYTVSSKAGEIRKHAPVR